MLVDGSWTHVASPSIGRYPTAGGNDLCHDKMIRDCIMLPYFQSDACETVIKKAEENIDTILKDNVRQILQELKRVKKDGIVVLNGYTQFFDADNGDCENESWEKFWMVPLRKLSFESLTKSRRERFNELVLNINKVLGGVVDEMAEDNSIGYKIGVAQWDQRATDVDGRMCSSKSNGNYPDPDQSDMQLIKLDTHPWLGWGEDVKTELRRRDAQTLDDLTPKEPGGHLHWEAEMTRRAEAYEESIYDSLLYRHPAPVRRWCINSTSVHPLLQTTQAMVTWIGHFVWSYLTRSEGMYVQPKYNQARLLSLKYHGSFVPTSTAMSSWSLLGYPRPWTFEPSSLTLIVSAP